MPPLRRWRYAERVLLLAAQYDYNYMFLLIFYSALMPADLITLARRAMASLMKFVKSSDAREYAEIDATPLTRRCRALPEIRSAILQPVSRDTP